MLMRRRTIAVLGSLALGVSGCGADVPPPVARRTTAKPLMLLSRPEVEPLRPVHAPAGEPPARARNPFTFGAAQPAERHTGPLPPLPPPEGLPELPLPMRAAPAIRLIGLASGRETPPVRMAILNVNEDLVLAHVGDTILGRYTLVRIGDDAVELRDSGSNESVTIALP
jgi:hypothetical protein